LEVEELLKRMRDSGLPKLWVPRRENFFAVQELPLLGSGKLDLKQVKEIAKRFSSEVAAGDWLEYRGPPWLRSAALTVKNIESERWDFCRI
jgi:hypothetical protein